MGPGGDYDRRYRRGWRFSGPGVAVGAAIGGSLRLLRQPGLLRFPAITTTATTTTAITTIAPRSRWPPEGGDARLLRPRPIDPTIRRRECISAMTASGIPARKAPFLPALT